jgi:hypothetical protein
MGKKLATTSGLPSGAGDSRQPAAMSAAKTAITMRIDTG